MPKRPNPFGDCAPLQWKTHVSQKQLNEGAQSRQRMQAVYERTKSLLFAGAQAASTDPPLASAGGVPASPREKGHCGPPDESGATMPRPGDAATRGQMYLGSRGQLLLKPPVDAQQTSTHLVCSTCTRTDGVHGRCSRCDRRVCRNCSQLCIGCASTFCTVCSAVDYNNHCDAVFCFDCRQ
ncbi:apoptosis regulatory protein Siva [Lampetra fluviatilis]